MTTEVQDALKKLKETRAAAARDFAGDVRTRPGHEMAQRQAQADLPGLEKKFAALFVKNIAFPIFLSGPEEATKEFVAFAKDKTEVVTLSYEGLFENLSSSVKASIGRHREFGTSQYAILVRELRQL